MADVPKTIELDFAGYRREPNVSGLAASSGIYCVYTCTYNKDAKPKPTVSVAKLVYIGESGDMRDRVGSHPRLDAWKRKLTAGQVLCFSAAKVATKADRQRAEAALIFKHKPSVNNEYTHSFPFDTTTIKVSGKTAKLTTSFKVSKDAED